VYGEKEIKMFSSGPKYQKLTTNLRLSVNRLKLLEKKKTELAIKARREISEYLVAAKEDRARIRVEHIIREDYLVEAMEIIEMYCDLLLARMGLIQTTKELDEGLQEPIASIIWATPRLQAECQELKVVSDQLTAKYGKEFAHACRTNELSNVNEKLMHKLGVQAPPKMLVEKYLEEIAKTYNVPFEPDPGAVEIDPLAAEGMLIDFDEKRGGGGAGGGGGMSLPPLNPEKPPLPEPSVSGPPPAGFVPPGFTQPFNYPAPPQHQNPAPAYPPPPLPSVPPVGGSTYEPLQPGHMDNPIYDNPRQEYPGPSVTTPPGPPAPARGPVDGLGLPDLPSVPVNSLPPGASSAGGDDVDFDDLTKRFEELKKRK